MTLGEKIRRERERQGFSIRNLASAAGISDVHLGRIERNKTDPTVKVLVNLAKALKKDIIYFFGDLRVGLQKELEKLAHLLKQEEGVEVYADGSIDMSDGNTVIALSQVIQSVTLRRSEGEERGNETTKSIVEPLDRVVELLKDRDWKWSRNFVEDLCKRMGIRIVDKPLPRELRGFCAVSKEGRYCILVNTNLTEQKNYTIAHEILHILTGLVPSSKAEILEKVERYIGAISLEGMSSLPLGEEEETRR